MNDIYYNKCYFEKECWWKFANVLSYIHSHSILLEEDFINEDRAVDTWGSEWFMELLDTQYPFALETDDQENVFLKQEIYDLFRQLQKRFSQHYVFATRAENADDAEIEAKKWTKKLFNVIEYTYKKYSKIIELYNSNYNDLMKQLESTTESGSRFNDTPQSAEVDLSFEENQFTTNLTKAKQVTRADSNTPIAKIEEIWQNYRKVILEWLNEFESLFVEENNV